MWRFDSRLSRSVLGFCVALWPALGLAAPAGAETPAADAVSAGASGLSLARSGGGPMYVLIGASVLAVAMIIYFFIVLRRNAIIPRQLHRKLLDSIDAGDLDEALRLCGYNPCALSMIAAAVLKHARNLSQADYTRLKGVLDDEGSRVSTAMYAQVQYLFDIAVLSPMVGLLGTVLGMMHAFQVVALDLAKAKPMLLAAGVSEAMVATAMGLVVGIPAMAFYAFFRGRVTRLTSELETAATDVLNSLLSRART